MDEPLPNINTAPLPNFFTRKVLAWAAGLLLALLLIIVILVIVCFLVFRSLYERAPDPIVSYQVDKTIKAKMPEWVPVEATVPNTIPVKLSKVLEADIPFKQDVDVWVDNDFTVPLDVTISVPIDQEIFVEADVPIVTEIPLDGVRVKTSLWGLKDISFPLSGTFPVNITIPFKGPLHVRTDADVRVQQNVTVHVNKLFTFPLDIKAHVSLPIDDVFQVSLPEVVTVSARVPQNVPVDVQVQLDLPKQSIFAGD
ncbi:MAG: hypothetical protein AB1724_06395 [Thermodesulfobacteriota bacterium]